VLAGDVFSARSAIRFWLEMRIALDVSHSAALRALMASLNALSNLSALFTSME